MRGMFFLRSDRRSSHTEHIVFVALAITGGHRNAVGYSSLILGQTECAYSPPSGRRFSLLPRITEGRGLAHKELRFSAIIGGGCRQARTATAVPSFAPREGIEPPNVAEYRATLSRISITIVPIHLERYLGVVYQNRFCG